MISTHTETGEKLHLVQGLTVVKPPLIKMPFHEWITWALPTGHSLLDQLDSKLKNISFCPLQDYQHFDGTFYRLLGNVCHWETNEPLVHYQEKEHPDKTWLHPVDSFISNVEIDGAVVPRFKFLGVAKEVYETNPKFKI